MFIDDSPRTIGEVCQFTNARMYCMDWPFNRNLVLPESEYTRVKSWSEFLDAEGISARVEEVK